MLYTGKGDGGTTKLFNSTERILKSAVEVDALGTLDELNSWLGYCRAGAGEELHKELESVQQNLFIIQAELAGAPKTLEEGKVTALSERINQIETELPPIKSFFLPGGSELAAKLDYARTIARRAERAVVRTRESQTNKLSAPALAYLNRLSSLCYALSRLENHKSGIKEQPPTYQ
jgi:cob(I)alamin adenosyltransferase